MTTFMGQFSNNYDGVILEFWRSVFDRQPKSARVVDLATGNGALAILAKQYSDAMHMKFTLCAVDYAASHPSEALAGTGYDEILKSISFHTNTRLERTGLPSGQYNLVCSQFGIEYAPIQMAIKEVVRILKPQDATFAAMIHVDGSAILEQAREGIRQVIRCKKSGLIGEVENLLSALQGVRNRGGDPAEDEACERMRETINGITGKLHSSQSQYKDPGQIAYFLANTMVLFRDKQSGHLSLDAKIERLHDIQEEGELYLLRMRDMVAAALSADKIAKIESQLVNNGVNVELSAPVSYEGQHFCHALIATR